MIGGRNAGSFAGAGENHQYDNLLRRTNLSAIGNGTTISSIIYGFDPASRLSTVSDGTGLPTYSHLANSPLVGQVAFKSDSVTALTTANSYDYLNRLRRMMLQRGLTQILNLKLKCYIKTSFEMMV